MPMLAPVVTAVTAAASLMPPPSPAPQAEDTGSII